MKISRFGFTVGDEVECISPPDCNDVFVGHFGKIIQIVLKNEEDIYTGDHTVLVEFYAVDEYGRENKSTWWCEPETLKKLVKNKQIEFEF